MADTRPIGVFDSGIGGLTVLREIWRATPSESTIYFGDNSRTPYGTKSASTVRKYSLQNMKFLETFDVKMIVIACNTASAYAYEEVSKQSKVPVVEVITPGADAACMATKNGRIGIIATGATVGTGVYENAVRSKAASLAAEGVNAAALSDIKIFQKACPMFVSLAEEGWWDNDIARLTAREYLDPLKEEGIDTLVLGCTHYPLLTKVISEVMGPDVKLINTGVAVAGSVREILEKNDIASDLVDPERKFYTSDDPNMFEQVASPFLGQGLPSGTVHVTTDRYEV
ncbi:MAG: glutamate racemase [Saccharofermentans sp.]|nr:glutamate racemase [Saccharofermentans sp.]